MAVLSIEQHINENGTGKFASSVIKNWYLISELSSLFNEVPCNPQVLGTRDLQSLYCWVPGRNNMNVHAWQENWQCERFACSQQKDVNNKTPTI